MMFNRSHFAHPAEFPMAASPRTQTLLIGHDYELFYLHHRLDSQSPERDICAFVYSLDGPLPFTSFWVAPDVLIPIYALGALEEAIAHHHVRTCVIQSQNLPMPHVRALIHRVLSTNDCDVDFLPIVTKSSIKSHKPLIVITSLAPSLGKSQVGRYMCATLTRNRRHVAVILPIRDIAPGRSPFRLLDVPDHEFSHSTSCAPPGLCDDDRWQVAEYLKSGADCVFVTSDITRAMIASEQIADVVILDARRCETPFVIPRFAFCVITDEAAQNVSRRALWPALVNLHSASNIVVFPSEAKRDVKFRIGPLRLRDSKSGRRDRRIFYAETSFVLDIPEEVTRDWGRDLVMAIDHAESQGVASSVIQKVGARELSPVVVRYARDVLDDTVDEEMRRLAAIVRESRADVVIASLQRDISEIVGDRPVYYTRPQMVDVKDALREWLTQQFREAEPPLINHFSAQVDVVMSMLAASDKELQCEDHKSANRAAFCRLFLSSHIPPGFRVTSGELIDASSNKTGPLSVVIASDISPQLTIDATGSIKAPILADTVLAVIDVKTNLKPFEIKKAIMQLRPVKALMPAHSTLWHPDGHVVEDPLNGKIITGIFGFRDASADLLRHIREIVDEFPGVVDFIVLPDSFGYFRAKTMRVCGFHVDAPEDPRAAIVEPAHEERNGYVLYEARGHGLAILFGILNGFAAIRRFSGSNCMQYLIGKWGDSPRGTAREAQLRGPDRDLMPMRRIESNPTRRTPK
jgi:hypothetical protein